MKKGIIDNRPVFLLILLSACLVSLQTLAQNNGAMLQYACNRAAVVMVRTEVLAEVNVQKIKINEKPFGHLLDSIQRLKADSIFLTPEEKLDIVLNEFELRPSYYFINEFNYFRHREKVTARGTGFIISGNGYVVTNCHVIDEDNAFINRQFILSAFNYVSETNINSIEQEWEVKFTEQQRMLLNRTFANVYSRIVPIELEKAEKKIFVTLTTDDENGNNISHEFRAVVKTKGSPMPGKDIAILKIDVPYELPTIPLSGSDKLLVGEELFVYGYPSPVSKNEYLSSETLFVPTLTKGIISGLKKTINGWPVIQMDAGINHGNSGGPVCNKTGDVIGICTFGSFDENARSLAPGFNFAIPLTVMREFLNDSIIPGKSRVSNDFSMAMHLLQQQNYEEALRTFEAVKMANPMYPELHSYIKTCKKNILEGHGTKNRATVYLLIIFIFSIISGGLAWYKIRK